MRTTTRSWSCRGTWAPVAAVLVLAIGWGRELPGPVVAVVGLCLIGSVLSAVHHAEVVAHRVGEPLGAGRPRRPPGARTDQPPLAYGSAIASIGLTIPAIALASVWLPGPLVLGLGPLHLVLLTLTAVVSALTVVPGRATLLQGGVHLSLFAAFVFLSFSP